MKGEKKGTACGLGKSYALEGEQKRFFFRKTALAEKGDGWEIALEGECGPQRFDVGFGKWAYGEMKLELQEFESLGTLVGVQHTAASGAWTAPDTFVAKVYLVDTPAWMQFTFKFSEDGTLAFTSKFWGWGGGDTMLSGKAE